MLGDRAVSSTIERRRGARWRKLRSRRLLLGGGWLGAGRRHPRARAPGIRSLQRISTYGDITGKVCGRDTLLIVVRFNLVLYLADFSGGIMFCDRDLVRERDLGHAEDL